jgi:hypothetical protein
MTDDPALRQALAYARRGWPVFPCQPGQKVPATRCCPTLKIAMKAALAIPVWGRC